MPTWLAIAIVVFVALVALLAAGGIMLAGRRQRHREEGFDERIAAANQALAAAHAADRGWEPATVEAAARQAFAGERPGVEVREVTLVQVIDPPGTDDDKAVFQVAAADGSSATVTLGRREGQWTLVSLA